MKLFTTLSASLIFIHSLGSTRAAPVTGDESSVEIPEESLIGFLDLAGDDISVFPVSNETHYGLMLVNSTIVNLARSESANFKGKREADAEPWHWLSFSKGEPMYKRDAEAEPWHWLSFSKGEPMY